MLTDLAEYLAAQGGDVTIISSRLRYDDAQADLPKDEVLGGVRVHRVLGSRLGRSHIVGRAIDYVTFYLFAAIAMGRLVRRGDVLLAKTDPPLISIIAAIVAKLKGARLVNWCQDLFPEVAGSLGMGWAEGPLGQGLRWGRNQSLKAAALNAVLCPQMGDHLAAEGVDPAKIAILPNWCDRDIAAVAPDRNPLRAAWGLTGKTVIGYSGNLGRAHMPEKILDLVERAKGLPDLAWLFIGGGKGTDQLKQYADANPDADIHFQPYQPREQLSESLSVADMHLISLDPACEGLIMPSKYYGVAAVSRPVIFLGSPQGAIADEIGQGNVTGTVLDSAEPGSWRATLAAFQAPTQRAGGAAENTVNGNFIANDHMGRWAQALRDCCEQEVG